MRIVVDGKKGGGRDCFQIIEMYDNRKREGVESRASRWSRQEKTGRGRRIWECGREGATEEER